MKTLTLLRHAKSDWSVIGREGATGRDFDRPLNPRGRRAARTVGTYLAAEGLTFDLVLASPALRVKETLDEVARSYGSAFRVTFDQRVYLGPTSTLLDLVRQTSGNVERLLLVGHNPGLEELALELTSAGGSLRQALEVKYPTAALAEIVVEGASWVDLAIGRLTRFVRPRDIEVESAA